MLRIPTNLRDNLSARRSFSCCSLTIKRKKRYGRVYPTKEHIKAERRHYNFFGCLSSSYSTPVVVEPSVFVMDSFLRFWPRTNAIARETRRKGNPTVSRNVQYIKARTKSWHKTLIHWVAPRRNPHCLARSLNPNNMVCSLEKPRWRRILMADSRRRLSTTTDRSKKGQKMKKEHVG